MKKEYDFSKGERGKFYRPEVELNIPVYLEPDVAKVVRERARKRDASVGAVVNDWLRKDIRSGRPTRKLKVPLDRTHRTMRDVCATPRSRNCGDERLQSIDIMQASSADVGRFSSQPPVAT